MVKSKYEVSWNEQITCYKDVYAETKRQAKKIAMETDYRDLDIDLIEVIGETTVEHIGY